MKLTSEHIIRNINLYLLSDIKLEEPYLSLYNDLNKLTDSIKLFNSKKDMYKDYIFYGENRVKLLFAYCNENKKVYFKGKDIRLLAHKYYSFTYPMIENVMKYFISYRFNLVIRGDLLSYMDLSNSGNFKFKLIK